MTTLGDYTLHAIETGRIGLDGGAMFGIVPKPLWAKRIAPDDQNRISLAMRCLLLRSDTRTVLIDCGLGDTFDGTKYRDIYAVDTEYSSLDRSLEAAGVSRADITDVILTHLHFDHCGGATQAGENGRETAFSNATYHVQRDHWNWAMESNPKEEGSFRTHTFAPIEESGQLQFVDGEGEILPGMEALLVNGHTHFQQMVKITVPTRRSCLRPTYCPLSIILPMLGRWPTTSARLFLSTRKRRSWNVRSMRNGTCSLNMIQAQRSRL